MRRFRTPGGHVGFPGGFFGRRTAPQSLVLICATGFGAYLCYLLAAPFISSLAWALCLAVLLLPVHRWIESKIQRAGVAAGLSVVIGALILVGPAVFVGRRLVTEGVQGAESIRAKVEAGAVQNLLASHPRLKPFARFIEEKLELPQIIDNAISWLTATTASLLRTSAIEAVRLLLTFYFLFYFLRDRKGALNAIKSFSPLPSKEMDKLFQHVADTIHATVYGTIVVSAVQGALGGAMFWWLGLPAPLFWGFVMALLAIVPIFGAFIVWIPAAVSLALDGNWNQALILTFWGAVVVGGIDNWIYPILVGNRLQMHALLAFSATVGGLIAFGASGIIIGPVALAITRFLLETWRARLADSQVNSHLSISPPLTH